MALIALVGASETLPDGSLRALVSVAGETLIERQAARLADVGVAQIAVAVGGSLQQLGIDGQLAAVVDRHLRMLRLVGVQHRRNVVLGVAGDRKSTRLNSSH